MFDGECLCVFFRLCNGPPLSGAMLVLLSGMQCSLLFSYESSAMLASNDLSAMLVFFICEACNVPACVLR